MWGTTTQSTQGFEAGPVGACSAGAGRVAPNGGSQRMTVCAVADTQHKAATQTIA